MTKNKSKNVYIEEIEQLDPRLGRHLEHDEASRAFAAPSVIDKTTWVDKAIRIYDPVPNPNQVVGNCTTCAKAMQFNSVGNRVTGRVLGMPWATDRYTLETNIDEFTGAWPPDDTGSSSLASCKTVQTTGEGGVYRWLFGGADQVVQTIMGTPTVKPHAVSLGSWWDWDMFNQDSEGFVHPGGGYAGGHQYIGRGYWAARDAVLCRCWWGDFRDFWITRTDLNALLLDGGDAHIQKAIQVLVP